VIPRVPSDDNPEQSFNHEMRQPKAYCRLLSWDETERCKDANNGIPFIPSQANSKGVRFR
jgi:hypothetical protein